jgi:aminoglycoside phosphotransferase (APT) family kinase protein
MVLRMSPPAVLLETHREREFQILRAMADDLPVPHAYWFADEHSALGTPSLITSFSPGVAAPSDAKTEAKSTNHLSTVYGSHRTALAPQFVQHLARLHTMDWSQKDLSALDVPAEASTEALDWRLALWDRVWEEDTFEAHPTVALARDWLWERRPAVDHVSLLHGDYRNGNFLFDESDSRITAILDWELGHLGDRHSDLAYAMLPGYGYTDESGAYLCAGLQDASRLITDYERLSGLAVDPERLRYYSVFNMYWAIVACYATASRVAAEQASHVDVVMNFVSGLAAFFVAELNQILREDYRR